MFIDVCDNKFCIFILQHKGKPFCHIPCYSALFGPTMFGHGSSVEAHKSFGKKEDKKDEKIRYVNYVYATLFTSFERIQGETKQWSYMFLTASPSMSSLHCFNVPQSVNIAICIWIWDALFLFKLSSRILPYPPHPYPLHSNILDPPLTI